MKNEGNIKVFCRFRPFNSRQLAANSTKLHRINNCKQLILKDSNKSQEVSFMYDHVFDIDSTQEQVFEKVGSPVLNNILDGFNGTIMAYGQTSSGKTHTMQGYDLSQKENRGIMPRIVQQLFTAIEKSPQGIEFKLKISIFQLYMEKVRDLLDVSKTDLKIREGKQGGFIQNLTEVYVSDKHQIFRIITIGQKNRITCATNMNEYSSRSHLIFLLTVNQTTMPEGTAKTSKLFMIDLAGSQKISKTGAQGKVLEEAKKINLSLTNLGKVIKALSQKTEKGGHVPYRDSKLTRILKDSLGGNSKTTLIVTCSPHEMHLPETITTLRFGQNAQKVKNKPKINKQLTVQECQRIIEKMEAQIAQKTHRIKVLEKHITQVLKMDLPSQLSKEMMLLSQKPVEIQQLEIQSEDRQKGQLQYVCKKEEVVGGMMDEVVGGMMDGVVGGMMDGVVGGMMDEGRWVLGQLQQRIGLLQEELAHSHSKMKCEMDKYYQLKKEYHDLHDNITTILKENIQLKDQMELKQRKSLFSDKVLQTNSYLIKLIMGEILEALGEQWKQEELLKKIGQSYWYKKTITQGANCVDFWHQQRQKLKRREEQISIQSQSIELQSQEIKKKQQNRFQKDNEKIIQIQAKLGHLFEQYNAMMALQTHWKAQCQLYEYNLRKKEDNIIKLQKQVEQLSQQMQEMYLYDDSNYFDDAASFRSNRIVKPIKGGFIVR